MINTIAWIICLMEALRLAVAMFKWMQKDNAKYHYNDAYDPEYEDFVEYAAWDE